MQSVIVWSPLSSNHPLIIHLFSQLVSPFGQLIRRINISYSVTKGQVWAFIQWILHILLHNKIMEKATFYDSSSLSSQWIKWRAPKDCPTLFEGAKTPLNHIPCRRVFHIKKLSWCVLLMTITPFIEMISLSSIRCKKSVKVCVADVNQIIITYMLLKIFQYTQCKSIYVV